MFFPHLSTFVVVKLLSHVQLLRVGAIKITKVIDYIGDYYILFGDRKSWYGVWCLISV